MTRADWPEETKLIIQLSFFSIGIFANILFCIIISRNRNLKIATNVALLSISVADILVCSLWIIHSASSWYRKWIFGEIGCAMSYGGLFISYYFIAFTIVLTFLMNLFCEKNRRLLVLIGIFCALIASVLIHVQSEKLSIFLHVTWKKESLCTVRLDTLQDVVKILKIIEFLVPLFAFAFYAACFMFEKCLWTKFLKDSRFTKIFLTMILVYITRWLLQILLEKHDILFLNLVQCLSIIYRPFIYAFMHDDVIDSLIKRSKHEEEKIDPVELTMTYLNEDIREV